MNKIQKHILSITESSVFLSLKATFFLMVKKKICDKKTTFKAYASETNFFFCLISEY